MTEPSVPMPAGSPTPLALDPETFRRLGYRAVDLAVEHLAGMRDRPVFVPMAPAAR
jgi:hypothetical protein